MVVDALNSLGTVDARMVPLQQLEPAPLEASDGCISRCHAIVRLYQKGGSYVADLLDVRNPERTDSDCSTIRPLGNAGRGPSLASGTWMRLLRHNRVYLAGAAAAHLVLRPAEDTDATDGNNNDTKAVAADAGEDEHRDGGAIDRKLKLLVTPKQAGAIIGDGGGTIRRITADPPCKLTMPRKWTRRSGLDWYRVALLSSPFSDALAECAARVVEALATARDGSKRPTVELRALYPARGMIQADEDVAGLREAHPGCRIALGTPGGERALALHGPPDGVHRVVAAVLGGLRPGDYAAQAVPQNKGKRPRSPPPPPPPGGGGSSKNRGKRRKRGMATAAELPSARARVKGHRGHPCQRRQETSTSKAADIEGGGPSRLG